MSDAAAIAERVRSGETTAVAETEAALSRAAQAAGLNLFTRLDPEGALEMASSIDAQIAAGNRPGALAGVPVALKDIIDQQGIPTTAGSSFLRAPAEADAPIVARLLASGAVIIGRTGLHEFAYGFSSENDWWGPVRNPWDPDTSPGGSSGGSAAAVAAGVTPIGIGTDTGGSVRVPAALCGVVGLKVTHGRIPLTGVFPLAASLDTVGPIARTVADAITAYLVMAGHDPADPWSVDAPADGVQPIDPAELVYGIPHPWVDRPLAPLQEAGLTHLRSTLSALGATVVDVEAPALDQRELHNATYHEVGEVHREWFRSDPERYGPAIRHRLAPVLELTAEEIEIGRAWRNRIVAGFDLAFEEIDVLLTPGTAAASKEIGVDTIDVGAGVEPYRPVVSWFTPLVNQAGIPALTVPLEVPAIIGLPPAIQFIGPAWSESRLLGLGLALEQAGHVAHRAPPHVARETG